MNHLDVWKESKERIKKSQPQHAFSTWFEPIKSIGLSDDDLVLEVPNQFFFEWIQSHYKETIQNEVKKAGGYDLKIKYTVSPEGREEKNINQKIDDENV